MSKRLADKYLTDQNWDDEEEPQEAGVFKAADDDVLKERVIKKAKRRNMESSSSSVIFLFHLGLALLATCIGFVDQLKCFHTNCGYEVFG